MARTRANKCFICGRVGVWGKTCSPACKQKLYRKNMEEKRLGSLTGISAMLIDLIGEDDAYGVFHKLNEISGKTNQKNAGDAVEQIIYAIQAKINNMIAESRD